VPLPVTAVTQNIDDEREGMPAGFMLLQSRERCDHLLAIAECLEPVIRYESAQDLRA